MDKEFLDLTRQNADDEAMYKNKEPTYYKR